MFTTSLHIHCHWQVDLVRSTVLWIHTRPMVDTSLTPVGLFCRNSFGSIGRCPSSSTLTKIIWGDISEFRCLPSATGNIINFLSNRSACCASLMLRAQTLLVKLNWLSRQKLGHIVLLSFVLYIYPLSGLGSRSPRYEVLLWAYTVKEHQRQCWLGPAGTQLSAGWSIQYKPNPACPHTTQN